MKRINICKSSSTHTIVNVKYCDSFLSKLMGLMFIKELAQDSGVILVGTHESRMSTAIHMLFMNFDITVLWLDKNMIVVDKALAKKWTLIHMPQKPAQYVLELHSSKFSGYLIGDSLEILGEK